MAASTQWFYASRVGRFEIRSEHGGVWSLWLDEQRLGKYERPGQAASAVLRGETGVDDWDRAIAPDAPGDLRGWSAA